MLLGRSKPKKTPQKKSQKKRCIYIYILERRVLQGFFSSGAAGWRKLKGKGSIEGKKERFWKLFVMMGKVGKRGGDGSLSMREREREKREIWIFEKWTL